jgi:hypothetical protein
MPTMRRLLNEVESNPDFRARMARDPNSALREFATSRFRNPLDTDPLVYRMVVGVLGAIGILAVVGCILSRLWSQNATAPETLTGMIALGSAAVGALAGLLAPQPKG